MRLETSVRVFALVVVFVASTSVRSQETAVARPTDLQPSRSLVEPETRGQYSIAPYSIAPYSIAQGSSAIAMGAVEQGFSPYAPTGPSVGNSLLQYMTCDPHSCPNIWAGYEAQRIADLNARCSCHGNCGGCGLKHHSSACSSCNCCRVKNRYRQGYATSGCATSGCATSGCSKCESGGSSCDSNPSANSEIYGVHGQTKSTVASIQGVNQGGNLFRAGKD